MLLCHRHHGEIIGFIAIGDTDQHLAQIVTRQGIQRFQRLGISTPVFIFLKRQIKVTSTALGD